MKILIIRNASPETQRLITGQFPADWKVEFVAEKELLRQIEDADVLIPENATIPAAIISRAKTLKLIQTGAGYDNVPIEECTKNGIYVANAPGVNAQAVAEHVFAFILCWHKNILPLNAVMKAGDDPPNYRGAELANKVIGIIGWGHIGKKVARLANAFNMQVLGYHYRPVKTEAEVEFVDWQTLLTSSDIFSVHVALNNQTRHMIGANAFEAMKPDAFLINTSRGAVIDESALIEALKNENIGGAGLDVFKKEPLPAESPLRELNNVILTPHMAGEPDGLFFHKKRFQFFADNIFRVLKGKPPRNTLNDPVGQSIEPYSRISPVILPEGYNGKILLVSVSGDGIKKTVLLRSGDLWHREILRNTKTEIKNLGFANALVHELGGALVRFEPDGAITIYSASQEFGACDKVYAAELVRKAFPERTVKVKS
jgi:D-3-phosphoglycerate dehydrogenase